MPRRGSKLVRWNQVSWPIAAGVDPARLEPRYCRRAWIWLEARGAKGVRVNKTVKYGHRSTYGVWTARPTGCSVLFLSSDPTKVYCSGRCARHVSAVIAARRRRKGGRPEPRITIPKGPIRIALTLVRSLASYDSSLGQEQGHRERHEFATKSAVLEYWISIFDDAMKWAEASSDDRRNLKASMRLLAKITPPQIKPAT